MRPLKLIIGLLLIIHNYNNVVASAEFEKFAGSAEMVTTHADKLLTSFKDITGKLTPVLNAAKNFLGPAAVIFGIVNLFYAKEQPDISKQLADQHNQVMVQLGEISKEIKHLTTTLTQHMDKTGENILRQVENIIELSAKATPLGRTVRKISDLYAESVRYRKMTNETKYNKITLRNFANDVLTGSDRVPALLANIQSEMFGSDDHHITGNFINAIIKYYRVILSSHYTYIY